MMAVEHTSTSHPSIMEASGRHHHHRQPHRSNSGKSDKGRVRLPSGFLPEPNSVICGRGKACTTAIGNRRLRAIVEHHLTAYSEAKTKVEKSNIVSKIMEQTMQGKTQGCFVRYEDGAWYEVDEGAAREKIGSLLRDCLHTQYRSSTKSKLARRRKAQQLLKESQSSPQLDSTLSMFDPSCYSLSSGLTSSVFDHRHSMTEKEPLQIMKQGISSSLCFQQQVTYVTSSDNITHTPAYLSRQGLKDLYSFLPDCLNQSTSQQKETMNNSNTQQQDHDAESSMILQSGLIPDLSGSIGQLNTVRQACSLLQGCSNGIGYTADVEDFPDDLSDIFND